MRSDHVDRAVALLFSASGADVFEVTGEDTVFTLNDSIDFNIADPIPEPGTALLLGMGLLGLASRRTH